MQESILIVDDDRLMRRSLSASLGQAGYRTQTAASAEEAVASVQTQLPNLVLLDIGLPGMDGLEALRRLRTFAPNLPIIYVTARRRELDEIVGLESGGDDYITKPFDLDVLLAHIKAVLRRSRSQTQMPKKPAVVVAGSIRIDEASHQVFVEGREVELAPRAFDLLHLLVSHAGRVVSTEEIFRHVWGEGWIGENQTLYVHVRWLREKIEADPANPKRLVTVRGVGYKLDP